MEKVRKKSEIFVKVVYFLVYFIICFVGNENILCDRIIVVNTASSRNTIFPEIELQNTLKLNIANNTYITG